MPDEATNLTSKSTPVTLTGNGESTSAATEANAYLEGQPRSTAELLARLRQRVSAAPSQNLTTPIPQNPPTPAFPPASFQKINGTQPVTPVAPAFGQTVSTPSGQTRVPEPRQPANPRFPPVPSQETKRSVITARPRTIDEMSIRYVNMPRPTRALPNGGLSGLVSRPSGPAPSMFFAPAFPPIQDPGVKLPVGGEILDSDLLWEDEGVKIEIFDTRTPRNSRTITVPRDDLKSFRDGSTLFVYNLRFRANRALLNSRQPYWGEAKLFVLKSCGSPFIKQLCRLDVSTWAMPQPPSTVGSLRGHWHLPASPPDQQWMGVDGPSLPYNTPCEGTPKAGGYTGSSPQVVRDASGTAVVLGTSLDIPGLTHQGVIGLLSNTLGEPIFNISLRLFYTFQTWFECPPSVILGYYEWSMSVSFTLDANGGIVNSSVNLHPGTLQEPDGSTTYAAALQDYKAAR